MGGGVEVRSARGPPPAHRPSTGPLRASSEPGLSPRARSRPNLKSEPVGAASGRGCPAWRPQPWMGGGEGADRVGLGAPGWGCRAGAPGSPCPRGASGRAWCCRPGRDWPNCAWSLLPTAPSLASRQAQPPVCSEVGKSLGISPPGWVHLSAWAGLGGGFESRQGPPLTCPPVCPQTAACPL